MTLLIFGFTDTSEAPRLSCSAPFSMPPTRSRVVYVCFDATDATDR